MAQETVSINKPNRPSGNENFGLRRLMMLIRANWYLFVIALVVTLAIAILYNHLAFPTYQVSTKVLIEEEDNNQSADFLEGFALRPGEQNLDNQIVILSSYSLVNKVVENLQFGVDVFRKGIFNSLSYYPINPIKIVLVSGDLPYNSEFVFKYKDDNQYRLFTPRGSSIKLDTILTFGQPIFLANGSFSIVPQPEFEAIYQSGKRINIQFSDDEALINRYQRRLIVSAISREGSIVNISLIGTNRVKDIMFLDNLTSVFINNNLEKKNTEAKRIIDFIDAQLVDVSDSLMTTENQLQEFRSTNMIMDISAQAQQIIDQSVLLENEKAQLLLAKTYYQYLDRYLKEDGNDEAPMSPATMGIEDPLLANLMQELAGLQAEYYSSGVGERNPLQGQLEIRIINTKQSILETLQGIILANQMALDENAKQLNELNTKASSLPVKERQLLGIERKFNLNSVLYNFLLTRRSEAQIQKASNMPDNEIIDYARASARPVAPNKIMVYLAALVFGLGFPLFFLLLRDLIRIKIHSEEDLKFVSDLPVVGHIPHSRLSYNTIVLNEPNSRISEAFRSLRTRLEFFTKEKECPIILLSSSIPGEGKSFSTVNLASIYSLKGKKTLLIDFDLRKPTLGQCFSLEEKVGLSNYLIGKNSEKDIIHETGFDNLSIIPSGPIPPNPGELSSSVKIEKLLNSLRDKYDYIIIDSAPIGTVSDNYSVASIADLILIMVRHGHTDRRFLKMTLEDLRVSGIINPGLLLNDIKSNRGSYRYAYNYKYEYKPKKK